MAGSSLTRRKGLSPGTKGLSQGCGLRPYQDEIAARLALAGPGQQDSATRHENSGGKVARKCPRGEHWHLYPVPSGLSRQPAERAPRDASGPRRPRQETGFSRAVKDAVRKRAGDRCEACGTGVPPGYGNFQHRLARKSGGRRGAMKALIGSIVNATLLCGTPQSGDHGLCEARDPHMHAQGFWLEEGQDPAAEPIMLHGRGGSGMKVWLTPEGGYSTEPPEGVAAA